MKKFLLILVLLSIVGCSKQYQWDPVAERCRDVNNGQFVDSAKCK